MDGIGFCRTRIRVSVAWTATSVGVGYGTGVCFGKNSAVPVIRSALVLTAKTR